MRKMLKRTRKVVKSEFRAFSRPFRAFSRFKKIKKRTRKGAKFWCCALVRVFFLGKISQLEAERIF
jgi:hypothetical protein